MQKKIKYQQRITYRISKSCRESLSAELLSPLFARSISKQTNSKFALIEKPKTGVLHPFDVILSGSRVSDVTDSDFERRVPRCAINSRTAPYIDGDKCTWIEGTII